MISIFVWCCLWQTKYFERMFHLWKRDRDVGVLSTWERLAEGAVLLSEWDFHDFFYYDFHCLEKKLEFNISYLKLPLQYWRNYSWRTSSTQFKYDSNMLLSERIMWFVQQRSNKNTTSGCVTYELAKSSVNLQKDWNNTATVCNKKLILSQSY